MAGGSIGFAVYGIAVHGMPSLPPIMFSTVLSFALAFVFFRLGFFGGADAKALMCIALLFPTHPAPVILSQQFPLFGSSVPTVFPFALTVLFNAAFLALAIPVSLVLRNLHSRGLRKFTGNFAMSFVAYTVDVGRLRNMSFVRLAHAYDVNDGNLKRRYSPGGITLDEAAIGRVEAYHAEGKISTDIWVTPEMPYMLFITLGFLASCLLGF